MRDLVWAEIRRRWRAAALVGLVFGIGAAAALTAAAGARRTAGAYPAMLRATNAAPLLVSTGQPDPSFYAQVAHVAGVTGVAHQIGVGLIPTAVRKGSGTPLAACSAASADGVFGYSIDEINILSGRQADPTRADEVVMTPRYTQLFGAKVGDDVNLAIDSTDPEPPAGQATSADGPIVPVRIVGIGEPATDVVAVTDLDDTPRFLATPAFVNAHLQDPATWCFDGLSVTTAPGVDRNDVARRIQALSGDQGQVFIQDRTANYRDVERAIEPQVNALWLFAAAAAAGTLLLIAQLLTRQLRAAATDVPAWRSFGLLRGQMRLLIAAPSAVTAVIAGVVALAVSVSLSSRFPIGPARTAEVHRGLRFDALVHGVGTVAVVAIPLVVGVAAAALALRRPTTVARPGFLAGVPGRVSSAPIAMGVHLATSPGRGREAIPVRTALAGTAVAIAAVVATITFAAGLNDLVSVPARYGKDWDVMVDGVFGPSPTQAVLTRYGHDPAVAAIAGGRYGEVSIDGQRVPTIGLTDLTGTTHPAIIDGRAAERDDEVVMGRTTLHELGRRVGDTVSVDTGMGPHDMTVVGVVAFPRFNHGSFSTLGLGEGALIRADQIPPLDIGGPLPPGLDEADFHDAGGPLYEFTLLRFRTSASASDRARITGDLQSIAQRDLQAMRTDQRPTAIDNYAAVRSTPLILSLLLGALAAATLAHLVVSVVRRRRRDLAVSSAIGMTRGQIQRAVVVHAVVVAVTALVVGVPLGLAGGRLAWDRFADDLGVVATLQLPIVALAIVVPAVVIGAALIALAPASIAAHQPAGVALRTE